MQVEPLIIVSEDKDVTSRAESAHSSCKSPLQVCRKCQGHCKSKYLTQADSKSQVRKHCGQEAARQKRIFPLTVEAKQT